MHFSPGVGYHPKSERLRILCTLHRMGHSEHSAGALRQERLPCPSCDPPSGHPLRTGTPARPFARRRPPSSSGFLQMGGKRNGHINNNQREDTRRRKKLIVNEHSPDSSELHTLSMVSSLSDRIFLSALWNLFRALPPTHKHKHRHAQLVSYIKETQHKKEERRN